MEVDTLKQEEEQDLAVAVLPPDAKAQLMGAITNRVGKAWDIALVAMWEIQENLLEVSTKS